MKIKVSDIPLFHGMEETAVEKLLPAVAAIEKHYAKGEIILREGEPTASLGIVLSGTALIAHSDFWGNNSILGSAAPGDVFAEAYACTPGEPLAISVTAAEDAVVLFVHVGSLLAACSSGNAPFAMLRNLLQLCAQKTLRLSSRNLHTRPRSIRGRLLSYFSECARRSGRPSFRLPYNRQQLADFLGVDRSAMCHELSRMQRDGLITYQKNIFYLTDAAKKQALMW